MQRATRRKEAPTPPGRRPVPRLVSVFAGALWLLTGCVAPQGPPPQPGAVPPPSVKTPDGRKKETPAPRGADRSPADREDRPSKGRDLSLAGLRRDRDRLRREVERLRGERGRWDAERRLMEDLLREVFGNLEKEDYPGALASIDRFLRANPGHRLSRQVEKLRPAVAKLQALAADREALREEIRKLKDIQFRFETLRKERR